jgi:hypothetical protein
MVILYNNLSQVFTVLLVLCRAMFQVFTLTYFKPHLNFFDFQTTNNAWI